MRFEPFWARGAALLGLLFALALLPEFLSSYDLGLVGQMLIYGIFAMSLDLLIGYTGLPSLGHAAYFGAAAYGAALFTLRLGWATLPAALAGLGAAVALAAVFNLLALRTSRSYYLMITLAFSQVLWSLSVSWTDLTAGDNGLGGLARPALFGWSGESDAGYFRLVLTLFAASVAALALFVRSPVGLALVGIRDNELRMRALGYNVWAYKYAVSLVAALFAGLAGELMLYFNSFVGPSALGVALSAQVLMMVQIGAAGTLLGPVLGAVVFVLLQFVLSTYTDRWLLVIGLVYIAVALYAPRGTLRLIGDAIASRRGRP